MVMTASSMRQRIQAAIQAIGAYPTPGVQSDSAYQNQIMEAFCQGIIDEIHFNGEAVGVEDNEGTGHVTISPGGIS